LRWRRKIDLACVGLMFSLALNAQDIKTADSGPLLRSEVLSTWTTEGGLPQNFVTALAQTSDGFLWVGTLNGLARFDGVHFRGFEKDGPPELQERILKLVRDKDSGMWIASTTGLFHYTHNRFVTISIPGNSHALIETLARAGDGGVWIVSDDRLIRTRGVGWRLCLCRPILMQCVTSSKTKMEHSGLLIANTLLLYRLITR
jgi:ligand-binding sensor domain-containing protein